jgi:zinc protease
MADVVVNPTFPEEEVELLRTRSLSGLQVALSQAATLANREFTRVLYGDHAYGRLETPATLEAVSRADVAAYHDTWFTPDGALFVVAGAVDADDVARRLEEAFAGWTPTGVPTVDFGAAPTRTRPEVVIVHQPGTVQAEIRVGHLLPGGDFDGYTALSVANQILGGRPSGRLFEVLREERGYTYDATSTVARARRASRFRASMAVRNEVAGEAVQELLNQVEKIRSDALPADELSDTKSFLTGIFPLQIETPQQVASQVTTNRLLGLPEDDIETYRSRVSALDTATVREAAAEYIRPERLAVVVAGDATQLQPQLAALGQVRIVDPQGQAIAMADLAPKAASERFDLTGLEPLELTYDVLVQGNAVGEMSQTLERVDDAWRLASNTALGPQTVEQEVVVDDGLVFRTASVTMQAGPQTVTIDASREGERVVGTMQAGPQSQEIDFQAADDVLVSDALDLALRVVELEAGKELAVPVANLQSGSVENVTVTVVGREEITVPAGTFDAWKVEVGGAQAQTIWLRDAFPHIPVRLAPRAQPVELQLKTVGSGAAGE